MGSVGGFARNIADMFTGGNTGAIADAVGVDLADVGMDKGLIKFPSLGGGGGGGDDSGLGDIKARTLAEQGRTSEDLLRQRDERNKFADQLLNSAQGKGPSLAEAQLRQAGDRTLAQQLAAARSSRGTNPALLSRSLMRSQAEQGQQLAGQSAIARLQEQQQQQNAYQNYLNSQQSYNSGLLGVASGNAQAAAQAEAQRNASSNALFGNLLGTAGTIVGGIYGGPVGAAAGGAVGSGLGGALGGGGSRSSSAIASKIGGGELPLNPAQSPDMVSTMPVQRPPWMTKGPAYMAASGGKVPGKPKVKGDDERNDTVHTLLSPGEVVVPRTVVSKSPEKIAEFVKGAKEITKRKPLAEALVDSNNPTVEGSYPDAGVKRGSVADKVKFDEALLAKMSKGGKVLDPKLTDKVKQLADKYEAEKAALEAEKPQKMSSGGMVFSDMLKSKYSKKGC